MRSRIAKIGVAAAWLVIALLLYANFDPSVSENTFSAFDVIAGTAFLLSAALWIVMWLEYFRERPSEYPLVWAFLLLTGPVLGPLLFYYRVWRKRYGSSVV